MEKTNDYVNNNSEVILIVTGSSYISMFYCNIFLFLYSQLQVFYSEE